MFRAVAVNIIFSEVTGPNPQRLHHHKPLDPDPQRRTKQGPRHTKTAIKTGLSGFIVLAIRNLRCSDLAVCQ
jgi:hypothetical protein